MKKPLKLLGALVVLVILIAIAVPFLISADYLKGQLAAQVKQATGRTLTIKGKASVSLFPSIAVKLEDVTLGNPAGFSGPYFANVKSLSVGAELMPLLNKQVKVKGITVSGATLNLEEAASGAKNWDFSGGKKETKPAKTEPAAGGHENPLSIDAIHIRNTTVSYHKAGTAPVKFDAKDIDADIAMHGADTKVNLTHMALYEGTAKANVALNTKTNTMALKLDLDRIQMDPLMTALTGESKLAGAASVTLDVKGKNGEQAAMMRSLNGAAKLNIADGAIKGINVASFLRDAKRGFVMSNSTTEKTDFSEMTASLNIVNGVASNDDLLMKSPILRLTGKGSLDLAARTINYRAVPSIVGTLKGQGGKDKLSGGGLGIPLIISGPWSAVSVMPDLAGIVGGIVTAPIDAVKNLKDAPAALEQNIKGLGGLFGGKKPN